jgi:transcriptional regulator with XRE-family HTH domain
LARNRAADRWTLADFVGDRRNELGLTQEAVSHRAGKTADPDWFGRIERGGRATLGVRDIDALERALELPAGALLELARKGY